MKNPYAHMSRNELVALRKDIEQTRQAHLREGQRHLAEMRKIRIALEEARDEEIGVSDHAVIRWLERVEGVDTDAIRRKIKDAIHVTDKVGDAHVVYAYGVKITMDGNRVTTVILLTPQNSQSQDMVEQI